MTPKAQLQDTAVEDFEIRLIIWEVNDIPLDGNDSNSLMCKALVDMEGDIEGVKIEKVSFFLNKNRKQMYTWLQQMATVSLIGE